MQLVLSACRTCSTVIFPHTTNQIFNFETPHYTISTRIQVMFVLKIMSSCFLRLKPCQKGHIRVNQVTFFFLFFFNFRFAQVLKSLHCCLLSSTLLL